MRTINFTLYLHERFRNSPLVSLFRRSLFSSALLKGQKKGNGQFHLCPRNSSACPGDTLRNPGSAFLLLLKGRRISAKRRGRQGRLRHITAPLPLKVEEYICIYSVFQSLILTAGLRSIQRATFFENDSFSDGPIIRKSLLFFSQI